VLSHHAPGVSPDDGIIAFTKTRACTGTFAATSGAVNPPNDCATITTSTRSPIEFTTSRVYSGRPASWSSPGRSTAITSCPSSCSSGTTRCQYQAGTSGARDQDEGAHENPPASCGQVWEITILHGVSPNVLGQRLCDLEAAGIVRRVPHCNFRLWGLGRALVQGPPILRAIR
jgi:hypothetical protein